jgi:hypothetical protein
MGGSDQEVSRLKKKTNTFRMPKVKVVCVYAQGKGWLFIGVYMWVSQGVER